MIPEGGYTNKPMTKLVNWIRNRRIRESILRDFRYGVRLNMEAFGYESDQLLYVFDPHENAADLSEETLKEYIDGISTACGCGSAFSHWYDDLKFDRMLQLSIPYMTLIEQNDNYVIYGLLGWAGTIKEFRKFAKDNFKYYRLIKTHGLFNRPAFNVKIESQDLMFKTLTGEMISRDLIL